MGGPFDDVGAVMAAANSKFAAEQYRTAYGVQSTVIYPLWCFARRPTRENVTLINPHPEKGRDLAMRLRGAARIFLSHSSKDGNWRTACAASYRKKWPAYRTLRFFPRRARGLRQMHNSARSQHQGRGIWPRGDRSANQWHSGDRLRSLRIARSRRPGGILLDPEGSIEKWVEAIRKLWQSDAYYAELSAAALAYAQRPEMDFERQIEAHEKALLAAAGKQK